MSKLVSLFSLIVLDELSKTLMEETMSNRTIKHEIKLQTSVIVILGILAVGVFANVFAPVFSVKDALAELRDDSTLYIECNGCN